MATVVYVDVLLVVNAVVNYFLLLMTAFFARENKKRLRLALAAFAGSLFSLTILLPARFAPVSLGVKLAGAAVMAAIAFGVKTPRRFLRDTAYLFIASGLLAGGVCLLAQNSDRIFVRNHSVYIDLSPLTLITATLVIYLLLCAVELLFRRPRELPEKCAASVETQRGRVQVQLLPDTGNQLRDAATGRSVVVLRRSLAPQLLDPPSLAALYAFEAGERSAQAFAELRGFALIPFSTLTQTGLLIGFAAVRMSVTLRRREIVLERPFIAFAEDRLLCGADGLAAAADLHREG
ncbi:MAG: sigma-E processing peptidase SpoIIGA [Oscillospiraceae bacterium]|nr:sigma-E processing peptidase SpoIIGA [Oscillospiraceae bacterium]